MYVEAGKLHRGIEEPRKEGVCSCSVSCREEEEVSKLATERKMRRPENPKQSSITS